MSFFTKESAVADDAAGGGDSSMFGITLAQLKELAKLRGKDFVEKLRSPDYNGVEGILQKLKVDRNTGLHSNDEQDLQHRRVAYGKNRTTRKPQSLISFFTSHTYVILNMLLVILVISSSRFPDLLFSKSPEEKEKIVKIYEDTL
jgi:hypothetical protein